ncbi:MAG: PqqD family protein [Lachnospiraceae bacterium]|nr:PqqD family protein [Lachnospiraceae bacterium]
MYIKKCFKLMKVGVQNIVVATGDEEEKFGGILRLNDTSAFLWGKLDGKCQEEDLVAALMNEYGIEQEVAQRSVDAFLSSLRNEGVLAEN